LVLELIKHPWERTRPYIEGMMQHPAMEFVSEDALEILLDHFAANHPNPKRFLSKPHVLAKIPAHHDLTSFPSPDFPDMASIALIGTKPPQPAKAT
jgi:hypothetical protein